MAQQMAKWGNKGFLVSAYKVIPFEGLSTTYELKQKANNDTSGTPSTNTTGRELQKISFETVYVAAAGVDVRAQIEEWQSLLGAINPLIIGGKQFGASKMQLTKVDVDDVKLTPQGKFISATVGITLTEYQPQAAKISTKKTTTTTTTTTASKTALSSGKALNKVAALSAKSTASDKSAMKPSASKTTTSLVKVDKLTKASMR